MKTDIELQKLLAAELPELIEDVDTLTDTAFGDGTLHLFFAWKDTNEEITAREWLWVVAECEKKLNAAQKIQYTELSASECQLVDWGYYAGEAAIDWDEVSILVFLTWQQRAVAYFKAIGKISIIP